MGDDEQASKKRARTVAYNPPGDGVNDSSGGLMEYIGSKGLVKRSEFIRVITDALLSLGFDDVAALLEEKSGVPLHSPDIKQFLKLVEDGEWDQCIDALKGFQLRNEKAVKFLIREQQFFRVLKTATSADALRVLTEEMMPLDYDINRVRELTYKLIPPSGQEDTESVNSTRPEFVERLAYLFPPAVIVPERRLECLVERHLEFQTYDCSYHNVPNSDLSIFSDHDCGDDKIPFQTVQTLTEHTNGVLFLKFSHNGKYLASSSKDKTAVIWEMNAEGKFLLKHKLEGHQNAVVAVLWRPDDQQVITCGENEVIWSWDVDSGAFIRSYEIYGVGSVSCGWFHDGSGVIGGMADKRIYLWRLDGTVIEHEQFQRAHKLSDVAMTTDGKWLISIGREQHEITLFNREIGRVENVIREKDMITSFSLSKDNRYLLINLFTQKIHLWNILGEPRKISRFDGHKFIWVAIRSCFGGYEEDFVASGSTESQVYIWTRTECEKPCRVLSGHSEAVNCVSWNPMDMHMLASASADRTIRIWGIDKKLN